MVEFSPATRETGVRFPANAFCSHKFLLQIFFVNIFTGETSLSSTQSKNFCIKLCLKLYAMSEFCEFAKLHIENIAIMFIREHVHVTCNLR